MRDTALNLLFYRRTEPLELPYSIIICDFHQLEMKKVGAITGLESTKDDHPEGFLHPADCTARSKGAQSFRKNLERGALPPSIRAPTGLHAAAAAADAE